MTTKEEYIDALNRMEEVYYNFDGCMSAMNMFKEGVNLLTGLVNEHFEEKAETNYKHYKDEVIQSVKYNLAVVNGEPKPCGDINCDECDFKDSGECVKRVREWLNQQYKEPTYKLSQFEYDLLNAYKDCGMLKPISHYSAMQELHEKGYFKDEDKNELIKDILEHCEVIKND